MKGAVPYRKAIRVSLAIVAFVLASGVLYFSLDAYREIQRLKTGSIWHLPSKVYSRPYPIEVGSDIVRSGLIERLGRLGYRKVTKVSAPGQFSRDSRGITLYTRPHSYMGEPREAWKVRLGLEGSKIGSIVLSGKKQPVRSVLLEPECIAEIFDGRNEDRTLVDLSECPKNLIDAIITTEDKRFYQHRGIDTRSLFRAVFINVKHRSIQEGGSTITQQLVKNLFLTNKRTFSRKIKDMWMAVIMETVYPKDRILSMYVNEIYMGSYGHVGICGLGRASKVLFDKDISELELHESALLAGMIKAPNAYSPYANPAKALARRNTVIALMHEEGRITRSEYEKARRMPLNVVDLVPRKRQAPYFIDYVLSLTRDQFPEALLEKGGYRIYTTLDMHMQNTAEHFLAHGLAKKDKEIDGAAVIMEPDTGEILALVGGKGYAVSQYNRAVKIRRHIGSLVKPVIYYTALRRGYTLSSYVEDAPISIPLHDGTVWTPVNYDRMYHGRVMLKDALAHSYNLATVKLGMDLGVSSILMEIGKVLPSAGNNTNPSVLLGALECSPLEVSAFYSAFANSGNQVKPVALKGIVDANGVIIRKETEPAPAQVLDPSIVYLVNAALQEAVVAGTARESRIYGMPAGVCGKTGTTDDARDSWFVGFTPQMVVTIWLGADKYRSIGHSGATGAMPIASMILARLTQPVTWPVPEDVIVCSVDAGNGKLAGMWTPDVVDIPYIRNTQPVEISNSGAPSIRDVPKVWNYLKSLLWKSSE